MFGKRDLVSISDLSPEGVTQVLEMALHFKEKGHQALLPGRTLAMLFEKPSLRTRVSFDVAMNQLGGQCIYLSPQEVGIGGREPVRDIARVLSRYVDCIALRTFAHDTVEEMAHWAEVPVINALSDEEHPCQALADLLTMLEKFGKLSGLVLAYVGDGNNVARSLCLGATMTGMEFRMASPPEYGFSQNFIDRVSNSATDNNGRVMLTSDPAEAVKDADIVYTDVWASMGHEDEITKRNKAFSGYQVTSNLVNLASSSAVFMHDLPAHRGEEVVEEVIEGPQSVVFDQAENRLHAQKAILSLALGMEGLS